MSGIEYGSPIQVEIPVRTTEGEKLFVFDVRAQNRPTAVHEARRYAEVHQGGRWPEYDDLNAYHREHAEDNFGIVGWRSYDVETARL